MEAKIISIDQIVQSKKEMHEKKRMRNRQSTVMNHKGTDEPRPEFTH